MPILKRDVNFVFFVIIIGTVISFAGFTAYYQSSFKNVSEEYTTKIAELNKVTKDLFEKKSILTQTTEALNETKEKVEEKEVLYSELRDERDTLRNERDFLKEDLFKTKTNLAQTAEQLSAANVQIQDQVRKIQSLNQDIEYWKGRKESCEDKLEQLGGSC